MYCSNCGTKLEKDDHFCPSCGHPADEEAAEPVVAETKPAAQTPAHAAPPPSAETPKTPVSATAKPKMSGCAIAAIVGGGALLVFLGIFAVVAMLVASTTSDASGALDDTLKLIRSGKVEEAHKSSSKQFQEITSLENFRQFLAMYPMIGESTGAKYSSKEFENNIATLQGNLVGPGGTKTKFVAQLVKEEEKWKLQLIQLPDAKSKGGTVSPDDFLAKGQSEQEESFVQYESAKAFEAHLQLLKEGDIGAAHTNTTPVFKESTTVEMYRQFVEQYPYLAQVEYVNFDKVEEKNGVSMLSGSLVEASGSAYPFQAQMDQVGGKWALHGLDLPGPQAPPKQPTTGTDEEFGGFDYALKKVSHPEYKITYEIPDGWIEQSNQGRFAIAPPKGDPMEGRAWMSLYALANTGEPSDQEIATAISQTLMGLADLKIEDSFPALTTIEGEPVKDPSELPPGQPGNLLTMVKFSFTQGGTPWKAMLIGVRRHDDKGRFHYVLTTRAEESAWREIEPVFERFILLNIEYDR